MCPRERFKGKTGFTSAESLLYMTPNGQILSNTFIHVTWLWLSCLLFAINLGDIISPIMQIMPLKNTHCFWWKISFCFSGVCWWWTLVPMGGRDTAVTVMGRPQGPQGQILGWWCFLGRVVVRQCAEFLLKTFFILYWSIVDLQCCVSYRFMAKWFSYIFTYIHSSWDFFSDFFQYNLLLNIEWVPCAIQ